MARSNRSGRSFRQGIPPVLACNAPLDPMEARGHRNNIRVRRNFPVRVLNKDLNFSIEGITTSLSQARAFIQSRKRHSCQVGALVVLTFFLPPDFTGQNKTIALQGDAVITRVDQETEGVAVEFIKTFREFERIEVKEGYHGRQGFGGR